MDTRGVIACYVDTSLDVHCGRGVIEDQEGGGRRGGYTLNALMETARIPPTTAGEIGREVSSAAPAYSKNLPATCLTLSANIATDCSLYTSPQQSLQNPLVEVSG
jgi:hypothetical protein